jgi:competence protein ComEA
MNQDSIRQFVATLRHWIAFVGVKRLLASLGGIITLLGASWFILRPSPTPVELVLPSMTTTASTVSGGNVHVHVVGAVKNPGVYTLPGRSRVVDAVIAAGGSLATADLEGINLAQTLMDAEQVFIPLRRVSQSRVTVAPRLKPRPRGSSTTVATPLQTSKIVNINTATASQLESLTGVGPATARAIIAYRTSKGSFNKVEDLLNVPGIGPAKLAAMRSEVSVS